MSFRILSFFRSRHKQEQTSSIPSQDGGNDLDIERLKHEIEQPLKEELAKERQAKEELKRELSAKADLIRSLREDGAKLDKRLAQEIEHAQQENRKLKSECQRLQEIINDAERSRKVSHTLELNARKLNEELMTKRMDAIERLNATVKSLETEKHVIQKRIERVQKEWDKDREKLREVQKENARLKRRNEKLEKACSSQQSAKQEQSEDKSAHRHYRRTSDILWDSWEGFDGDMADFMTEQDMRKMERMIRE